MEKGIDPQATEWVFGENFFELAALQGVDFFAEYGFTLIDGDGFPAAVGAALDERSDFLRGLAERRGDERGHPPQITIGEFGFIPSAANFHPGALLGFCERLGHVFQGAFGFFLVEINVVENHDLHRFICGQQSLFGIEDCSEGRRQRIGLQSLGGELLKHAFCRPHLQEKDARRDGAESTQHQTNRSCGSPGEDAITLAFEWGVFCTSHERVELG